MTKLQSVDAATYSLNIFRDLSIAPSKRMPGPPQRIDGMTVGIITITEDAPHNGEMHPDGDEILHVISGRLSVSCDSFPSEDLMMGPGDTCIVPKGLWHKVSVLEETSSSISPPAQTASIAHSTRGWRASVDNLLDLAGLNSGNQHGCSSRTEY